MIYTAERTSRSTTHRQGGFTLIELMIVVAIIAIILTLALPVYSNYTIRSKISEGLSVAMGAKTSVAATCVESRNLTGLDNTKAGYDFSAGSDSDDYVDTILVTGDCTAPVITVTTKNTGQSPDPIIILTGEILANSGQVRWRCSNTNTPYNLLPASCRNSS